VVKGFELEPDRFVVVEPGDLEALKLESTRCIELVHFVGAADLDPLLLDTPYFLGPDGPVSEEAFAVLREALSRRRRLGLGQVVMGGRERLVCLRPGAKGFILTSLRYPAELRRAEVVFEDLGQSKIPAAQVRLAEQLIERKTGAFDPAAFVDRYQTAVKELIAAKLQGGPPIQVLPHATAPVLDLTTALQESLDRTGSPPHKKTALAA